MHTGEGGAPEGCAGAPACRAGGGAGGAHAGSQASGGSPTSGAAGSAGQTLQRPPVCGSGVVDPETEEECDDGNRAPFDGCSGGCKLEPYAECPAQGGPCEPADCGNGARERAEQCDDGNLTAGDGCNASCRIQSALWDCPADGGRCTLKATCGNGVVEQGEVCDDGDSRDGDDCASDCRTVPRGHVCLEVDEPCASWCGDGVVTDDELCDDGDNVTLEYGAAEGACAPGCVLPPRCGDGVLDPPEECDDGEANNVDSDAGGCSATCTTNPYCGDGLVALEQGEECDYGAQNEPAETVSYGGCTTGCRFGPRCGDGKVDMFPSMEDCDDGNLESGDGCDSICLMDWEVFWGPLDP
ncbi:MAG: DUF4215 domain-containing protein [Polyangiaceae bacterium]|nr:DUF4215 domain-containing protein [Polyangiaceae bacterium]